MYEVVHMRFLYYWRDSVLIVVQYSISMEKPQSVSQCKLPTKQFHDLKWPAFGLTSSGQHLGLQPSCWPLEVMQL